MWDQFQPRLQELARRAGIGEVPPRLVGVLLCVAVLGLAWAAWRWLPQERGAKPVLTQSELVTSEGAALRPSVAQEATAGLIVHVVGSVRRPGVYELPAGSRAIDAVDAAGGLLPDAVASRVNLAQAVTDGVQVAIPSKDDEPPSSAALAPASPGIGPAPLSGELVDLNTADIAALDTLPGVGPSTAQKIVADRESNGPFATVDDLGRVSGIGPKKLDALRDLVRVR